MNEPATQVIHEDDERTIVDRRFQRPACEPEAATLFVDPARFSSAEPPFEGSGRAIDSNSDRLGVKPREAAVHAWMRGMAAWLCARWRLAFAGVLLLALLGAVGALAYRERRLANELRETIHEMRRNQRAAPHARSVSTVSSNVETVAKTAGQGRPAPSNALEREALERRAVDLLVANNHRAALVHYRSLTKRFPDETVFGDFVVVLEWKLRCNLPERETDPECL